MPTRWMPDRWLDLLARPEVRVHRPVSAFHVCGSVGLLLGAGLGVVLTLHRDLSLWVLAAIVLTAVATFLALAMVTKIVLREEQLIYYHHEVAILGTVTVLLALLGEPVLPYLDVTILGVGTFLFCGRVGCFMVGCCHGRPCRWGVRYRAEHAEAGFTPYYVGVRLFPIQLVESAWVLITVVVGVWLVLGGAVPGATLAWYVIVYDVGRFCFEFGRGDPARPYRAGFSEGQWTSLLLMLLVVGAELAGAIPLHAWHLAATSGVVLTMGVVAGRRRLRRDMRYELLNPNHVEELANAVDELATTDAGGPTTINVRTTSVGLKVSAGRVRLTTDVVDHYTLSMTNRTLTETSAHLTADLIGLLRQHEGSRELFAGSSVFHLLMPVRRAATLHQGGTVT